MIALLLTALAAADPTPMTLPYADIAELVVEAPRQQIYVTIEESYPQANSGDDALASGPNAAHAADVTSDPSYAGLRAMQPRDRR